MKVRELIVRLLLTGLGLVIWMAWFGFLLSVVVDG